MTFARNRRPTPVFPVISCLFALLFASASALDCTSEGSSNAGQGGGSGGGASTATGGGTGAATGGTHGSGGLSGTGGTSGTGGRAGTGGVAATGGGGGHATGGSGTGGSGAIDAGTADGPDAGRDSSVVSPDAAGGSAFAAVQAILTAKCMRCHNPAMPVVPETTTFVALNLTPAGAYGALVGKSAVETCGGVLVTPGDVARSYLYHKVVDAVPCSGGRMPAQGMVLIQTPLSAPEIATIASWISAGAKP